MGSFVDHIGFDNLLRADRWKFSNEANPELHAEKVRRTPRVIRADDDDDGEEDLIMTNILLL